MFWKRLARSARSWPFGFAQSRQATVDPGKAEIESNGAPSEETSRGAFVLIDSRKALAPFGSELEASLSGRHGFSADLRAGRPL